MTHLRPTLLLLLFFLASSVQAQSPSIQWQHIYGDLDPDTTHGLVSYGDHLLTSARDGGAVFLSTVRNNANGVTGVHIGGPDILVVKINSEGKIEWQKVLGGTGAENVGAVLQTHNGSYVLCGTAESRDGDLIMPPDSGIQTPNSYSSGWIVKLGDTGAIEWNRRTSGTKEELLCSVSETSDHGFIAAGYSYSGDEGWYNHGIEDAYIVRVDSAGNKLWQRNFGGSRQDEARSILALPDGGYIFAGWTTSDDGDVQDKHTVNNRLTGADAWIVRLDAIGQIIWQRCYGGISIEAGNAIHATVDGGFIVAGVSYSNNGDVTGHHDEHGGESLPDGWIFKIDALGSIEWQKSLGGSNQDIVLSITTTRDSGYLVTGYTFSSDIGSGVPAVKGKKDTWVSKLSSTGEVEWTKILGGSDHEIGFCTIETDDGYLVYSTTKSVDGDLAGAPIGDKPWLVKLSHESGVESSILGSAFKHPYPNPSTEEIRFELSHSQRFKQIRIVDMSGREYHPDYHIESVTAIIDMRSLPPGAYMAHIDYLDKATIEDIRKFVRE